MKNKMRIGEFAEQAGVTPRTIRYYEDLGLLGPNEREGQGFRYYSDAELVRLKKIDWLKQRSVRKQEDHRAFKRFQPRDPRSTVRLESGEVLRCFVIDLSRGGAALSCQHAPQLGEKLVLGTVACHVVRKLAVGFAVQFETPQEPDGLEQLAAGFEPTA